MHPIVGIVWPEPLGTADLHEINHFTPPKVTVEAVAVEPAPDLSGGITLAHVRSIAADPNIEAAGRKLAALGSHALAYACTSGSYVRGLHGDTDIAQRMHDATNRPATTTATATVRALEHLQAKRVAVLSPHIDSLNTRLQRFLESHEVEVVQMVGLNRLNAIDSITPDETLAIVQQQVDHPDADTIFISCTGLRVAPVITTLERKLAKPVTTAIQTTMWDVLRLANAFSPLPDCGQLYTRDSTIGSF
jgi:maleate isomerase